MTTYRKLLSEAVSTLRKQGPRIFVAKTAAALGVRRLLLLEADLEQAPASPPAKLPLEFRLLLSADVDRYLASEPEKDRAKAERELAAGHSCFLALLDGQVTASTWMARDFVSSSWGKVRRPLGRDEAYVFGAHTAKAFRGRGFNHALTGYLIDCLRGQGVRRAYRLVVPWNGPARAAHRKSGFAEQGQYLSLSVGPFGRSLFVPSTAGARATSNRTT